MSRVNLIVIFFLVFGILVRIAFALYMWLTNGLNVAADQMDYIQYAQQMSLQGPFVMDVSQLTAFCGPGFPFLVFVLMSFSKSPIVVIIINIILSGLTLWIHYLTAKNLISKNAAIVVLAISAVYVPFFIFSGYVLKETLLYFCLSMIVYLLTLKNQKYIIILAAFFFVWAFHIDERYLLYTQFLLIPIFAKRRKLKDVFIACLWLLLFSAPWLIRNYQVYDRVVIVTERFMSPIDRYTGIANRLNNRESGFHKRLIEVRDSTLNGEQVHFLSSRERVVVQSIKDGLIPHDYTKLEKFKYNLASFWSPIRTKPMFINSGWKYAKARSMSMNLIYGTFMIPLIAFLFIALFISAKRRDWLILFFGVLLLYHTLAHVILISGLGRYRFPLDNILILTAVWGLFQMLNRKEDSVVEN
jgi:hypothetical protein